MNTSRMKPVPMLFPAMGSIRETEIRRVEFDAARTIGTGKEKPIS